MSELLTKEALAGLLNGRQYREEITRAEAQQARESGLLVAFGASDDLLELRGIINDEFHAYTGCEIGITASGIVINDDREEFDRKNLIRAGWTPPAPAFTIKAEWCPASLDTAWLITSSLPQSVFDIMEDGRLYCRGIVVDTKVIKTS